MTALKQKYLLRNNNNDKSRFLMLDNLFYPFDTSSFQIVYIFKIYSFFYVFSVILEKY